MEIGTSASRSEMVRQANLSVVLRSLHLRGASTRSDLVAETGLTRSAIGVIVSDLVELDLVGERRAESDGRPGRPSPIVATTDRHVVLGMEVMVDSIAVGVFHLGGRRLGAARVARDSAASPGDAVESLIDLARDLLSDLTTGTSLHGVGLAVAGVVAEHDGSVLVAPNLGWADVPIAEMLREAIGVDVHVAVGNEGDLGALAETRRGVATGLADVVYVSGEIGVGGGVIVDGRPVRGAGGFAGEVGHIPVAMNGRPCGCGSTGCWETEIGERALLRRLDLPDLDARAAVDRVVKSAAAGDEATLDALAEHGEWVGFGLAGIINAFDPELIVLGGSFARLHPYIASSIELELHRRIFDAVRARVRVAPSQFGSGAPLTGAAERVWDLILDDPIAARRASDVGHVGALSL